MNRILTVIGAIGIAISSYAQHANEKLIVNKWKMVKTTQNGDEVKPSHEKLTIEFKKKNKEYLVTAVLEETHSGTWIMSADGNQITLKDADTKEEKVIDIVKIDKLHLNISHYDGVSDDVIIETIPLGKEKAVHLTHKEHLLAKVWHLTDSPKKDNEGAIFEFLLLTSFSSSAKFDFTSAKCALSSAKFDANSR